jgi:hypothetical protein
VPLSAGGELKSSNDPNFQETPVPPLENDLIWENLLHALDLAASPGASGSDKVLLTQKWQLYRLNYLKESAKLDAQSDNDIKCLACYTLTWMWRRSIS